jgi:hypothetical protein
MEKGERMNRIGSFLMGIIFGVVGLHAAMHFTLVRAADGVHLVQKIAPRVEFPYSDIRSFGLAHWQKKQGLALAILKAKKGYLIQDPSLLVFKQSTQKLLDQYTLISSTRIGG